MEWSHVATAYILRWNKPDHKVIIGVFLTREHLEQFLHSHFSMDEIARTYFEDSPMKIEEGKYYRPRF